MPPKIEALIKQINRELDELEREANHESDTKSELKLMDEKL